MAPTAGTRLRMKNSGIKPKKKSASLKNQIRSLERIIAKNPNNEELVLKNKTQLEELKKAIGDKQVALREKKHSTKYKMVKFFERKKLIRKLQQLEKEDENQQAKDLIIRDLQYIFNFPKGLKYISLYPKKNPSAAETKKMDKLYEACRVAFENPSDELMVQFKAFCDPTSTKTAAGTKERTAKSPVSAEDKVVSEKNTDASEEAKDEPAGEEEDFFLS